MIRHRGGSTRHSGDEDQQVPTSPARIGRTLRNAREERGLDLLTVHDRLGRPITLLEALEAGDLAALPDQVLALSTLRRYAAFLSLDGDAMALELLDAWPESPAPASRRRAAREIQLAMTGVVTAVNGPEHLRAFTQTGEVPSVAGTANWSTAPRGSGPSTGPPTGMLLAIQPESIKETKRAHAKARWRRRAPTALRVVTWLVALVLLATLVGLGLSQWRPATLVQYHVLRVVNPAAAATTLPPSVRKAPPHPKPAAVQLTSSDNLTRATYTVAAGQFTVSLATSGECWVQVTSPASIAPLLEGVLQGGQVRTFPSDGSLTVQVGSSAVVVGVSIGGKNVFLTTPKVAPFTYTFESPTVAATGSPTGAT